VKCLPTGYSWPKSRELPLLSAETLENRGLLAMLVRKNEVGAGPNAPSRIALLSPDGVGQSGLP